MTDRENVSAPQGAFFNEKIQGEDYDKKILERDQQSMQTCNSVSAYDDLDVVGIDKSNTAYFRSGSCCGYQ